MARFGTITRRSTQRAPAQSISNITTNVPTSLNRGAIKNQRSNLAESRRAFNTQRSNLAESRRAFNNQRSNLAESRRAFNNTPRTNELSNQTNQQPTLLGHTSRAFSNTQHSSKNQTKHTKQVSPTELQHKPARSLTEHSPNQQKKN